MRLHHPWRLVLFLLWILGSPVIYERLTAPGSSMVGPDEPAGFLTVVVWGVLTVALVAAGTWIALARQRKGDARM